MHREGGWWCKEAGAWMPCLGTEHLGSELILVCFRGCVAGSSCIRFGGSWCAGLSTWPRGGELRKGVMGDGGGDQSG